MWSKPWSYKEGLIIGAGLLVIGALPVSYTHLTLPTTPYV